MKPPEYEKELAPIRAIPADQVKRPHERIAAMAADFRLAFRNDPHLLRRVSALLRGSSRRDLVRSLSALVLLGNSHADILRRIRYDSRKLDDARATAADLAKRLESVKDVPRRQARDTRDCAYRDLRQAFDEIRQHGRAAFRNNDRRKKLYARDRSRKSA